MELRSQLDDYARTREYAARPFQDSSHSCHESRRMYKECALDALTEAGKAELDGETVGGCFQVLPWLTLVRDCFEILQSTVLSSRPLSSEELAALEDLNQVIGRLANKTARVVCSLLRHDGNPSERTLQRNELILMPLSQSEAGRLGGLLKRFVWMD